MLTFFTHCLWLITGLRIRTHNICPHSSCINLFVYFARTANIVFFFHRTFIAVVRCAHILLSSHPLQCPLYGLPSALSLSLSLSPWCATSLTTTVFNNFAITVVAVTRCENKITSPDENNHSQKCLHSGERTQQTSGKQWPYCLSESLSRCNDIIQVSVH